MLDNSQASVDMLGGIRYWHLKTELQFQPGLLPGIDVQDSRGWVDGIHPGTNVCDVLWCGVVRDTSICYTKDGRTTHLSGSATNR